LAIKKSTDFVRDYSMNSKNRIFLALIAIAVTAGALWFANRPVTPIIAVWEDVLAEARQGSYQIISTDELWEQYNSDPSKILLVDTRQEWEYRSGHLKGAVNFPIEPTWLSRWRKKGALEEFLGSDKNRFIVFY